MTFSLSDLALAYRKAKVDLYYSTNPSLFEIANYEDKLSTNLLALLEKLNGDAKDWVTDKEFLGSWILIPKGIKFEDEKTGSKNSAGLIFAAPDEHWKSLHSEQSKSKAEFRLMARCSMEFHVLAALWMMEVGDAFDAKLTHNVYGSRLRRDRHEKINRFALGSFKPYLKPFRDWRDGGIKAMRTALENKKKVLALTADVSSFYHELNPGFMLDKSFHAIAGIELNEEQNKLNELFITALTAWAHNTPLKKGLPVGLPASAVVANSALIKLDQFIEQQVVPLYYGRYVDDILLVMENTSDIQSTDGFWEWIFSRDGGKKLLAWENESDPGKKCIRFKPKYLNDSRIAFENNKNKLFVLAGGPGIALVNAIAEQIHERASEWRSLPNLPNSPESIATDLLKATNNTGEHADNLRKTDSLSLHRAGFALSLRDYEAYERDLPLEAWQEHRHAFLRAVIDHLLTPVKYFELAQYLPRIIRMATACEDFKLLAEICESLLDLRAKISNHCTLEIKADDVKHIVNLEHCWVYPLMGSVVESIVSAFPPRLGSAGKKAWDKHMQGKFSDWSIWSSISSPENPWILSRAEIHKQHARLFSYDLAHTPLRFVGIPKEMASQRGIPSRKNLITSATQNLLPASFGEAIQLLAKWLHFPNGGPVGLSFSTRPFSLIELYLIAPEPFERSKVNALDAVIRALRGFDLSEHQMPYRDKHNVLRISDGEPRNKQTIAVSSWETSHQSYIAAILREPDPSVRIRYQRLNRLINELISRPDGAGYLLLPETSLPPQWFMRIADKLKGRGISLIAGVEYLHAPKKRVRNQVWASLTHDGLGFPSLMLFRQDKQRPALHEEEELFNRASLELRPAQGWTTPPVIEHGDFRFALMVCSELTNIHYRASLRGKVDALFVPEWNSDTDTFNALIEATALDVHAYIVQCNNRLYGDSRIRAPYKDRWKRDVLRVKGGNHDYCITGEIDITALRQFQSNHRSPAKGFKPVPDGFNEDMAHQRRLLPKGDEA